VLYVGLGAGGFCLLLIICGLMKRKRTKTAVIAVAGQTVQVRSHQKEAKQGHIITQQTNNVSNSTKALPAAIGVAPAVFCVQCGTRAHVDSKYTINTAFLQLEFLLSTAFAGVFCENCGRRVS
jgi:hypothetical protein